MGFASSQRDGLNMLIRPTIKVQKISVVILYRSRATCSPAAQAKIGAKTKAKIAGESSQTSTSPWSSHRIRQ